MMLHRLDTSTHQGLSDWRVRRVAEERNTPRRAARYLRGERDDKRPTLSSGDRHGECDSAKGVPLPIPIGRGNRNIGTAGTERSGLILAAPDRHTAEIQSGRAEGETGFIRNNRIVCLNIFTAPTGNAEQGRKDHYEQAVTVAPEWDLFVHIVIVPAETQLDLENWET